MSLLTELGRYRVLSALGKGGMGEVYLAEDTLLDRRVALKLLPESVEQDGVARERFAREAKSAAALDHPFICKIYETGESAGRTYLAMEYVPGETLLERLTRGPLPLKEALQIAAEIAEALEEAHRHRIIHRDLKPANVMLGRHGHVKVMDFGLAKQLPELVKSAGLDSEAPTREGQLTGAGVQLGTPAYMSPEQLLGHPVDERSDIFSFGVVLSEMLTGAHPFQQGTVAGTVGAILYQRPAPSGATPLTVPLRLALDKMLAKNPTHRYATFASLRTDLLGLAADPSGSGGFAFLIEGAPPSALAIEKRIEIVGREAEVGTLGQLLDELQNGRGALALIGGEPGVGKTRLAEEIIYHARLRRMLALVGHCYPMEGAPPFLPFVEILEHAARVVPPSVLRDALGEAAPEIARLMPELRRAFPDLKAPLAIPPELQRRYLFNSFLDFVGRASRATPLVLLLDDLHWGDESSLLLLQHLAPHLGSMPLLILGTYRDAELDMLERGPLFAQTLEALVRQRLARRISLARLPEEGVARLLQALSGQTPPPDLARRIYDETEGNPFFVEEVFHHLREEGALFDAEQRWRPDLKIDDLRVPEGVRLVIGRRLERLSEPTRRTLSAAAVIGRSFSLRLLEALSDLTEDRLLDAVEEAERAQIIASSGKRESRYAFAHELIRQTLAGGLSQPRRERLHLRVAEAIETVYPKELEKRAADLAHHLESAGDAADSKKTLHYLKLALDQALAATASESALRYGDAALPLVEPTDTRGRADLLFKRGLALRGVLKGEEALLEWQKALVLYEELHDVTAVANLCWGMGYLLVWAHRFDDALAIGRRGLAVVGERESAERCRLLAGVGHALSTSGQYGPSRDMLLRAGAMAEELADPHLLGEVLSLQALQLWQYTKTSEIQVIGARAIELLRQSGDFWELATALSHTQLGLLSLGRWDEMARMGEELEPLAARLGHPGAMLLANAARAFRELLSSGDLDRFETFVRSTIEVWTRSGLGWLGVAYLYLVCAQFLKGQWAEALETCREAQRLELADVWEGGALGAELLCKAYCGDQSALGGTWGKASLHLHGVEPYSGGTWILLVNAVQALSTLGARSEAARLYPRVLAALETGTVLAGYPPVLIQKVAGIAAAAGSDWKSAEEHFETALGQARDLPHRIEQADVPRAYAEMLLARGAPGDRPRADKMIEEAIESYRRLGMHGHLRMAEAIRNG